MLRSCRNTAKHPDTVRDTWDRIATSLSMRTPRSRTIPQHTWIQYLSKHVCSPERRFRVLEILQSSRKTVAANGDSQVVSKSVRENSLAFKLRLALGLRLKCRFHLSFALLRFALINQIQAYIRKLTHGRKHMAFLENFCDRLWVELFLLFIELPFFNAFWQPLIADISLRYIILWE